MTLVFEKPRPQNIPLCTLQKTDHNQAIAWIFKIWRCERVKASQQRLV